MTDKQIIIDDADVSKCKYIDIENFENPICNCISQRNECKIPCENNKDCYYKQLKRKEQEYNKLKQTLTEIKEIAEGMHDLWINKTPYTDMDNLVKHLLECELNRIRYKLDEISECEAKNENIRNL